MRRVLLPLLLLSACDPTGKSPSNRSDTGETRGTTDGGDSGDTDAAPPGEGCRATPRDADADRVVLANLSFDGSGADWAVLTLTSDGTLTDTGDSVTAGRTYLHAGVFTPDGSLGVVALEDGSLTIFAVDDSGTVTIVESGWTSGFYAGAVSMDPSGERVYVADQNVEENGGGLYIITLDCDTGLPSLATDLPVDSTGRLAPARLPAAVLPVPGQPDQVAMVGGVSGADVTLVELSTGTILDEIDVFGDDAWLSAGGITAQGDLILLTDTSAWSGEENSAAAVSIHSNSLTAAGRVELYDGVAMAIGSDGSTAVVSSGYGDDILRLTLDSATTPALSVAGSLSTTDGPPQLPGGMVSIQRGTLNGYTLVAEVYGIRSVMVGINGDAMDLGVTGGRIGNPAALLVQP